MTRAPDMAARTQSRVPPPRSYGKSVATWRPGTARHTALRLGCLIWPAAVMLPSARGCLPAAQLQRQPEIDLAAQAQAERGVEEGRA